MDKHKFNKILFGELAEECDSDLSSLSNDDDSDILFDLGFQLLQSNSIQLPEHVKINSFETILFNHSDEEFLHNFRLKRIKFLEISEDFQRTNVALVEHKQVAIFLWFAGHRATFEDVSYKFNISLEEVLQTIIKVSEFVNSTYNLNNLQKSTSEFYSKKVCVPQIAGCVGVTEIPLESDCEKSIALHAICDENNKFLDIAVSEGDFESADISTIFPNLSVSFEGYKLISEPKYGPSNFLLTPSMGDELNDSPDNQKLLTCLLEMESTFTFLKRRFLQLNFCTLKPTSVAREFVKACCILHNLAEVDDLDLLRDEDLAII